MLSITNTVRRNCIVGSEDALLNWRLQLLERGSTVTHLSALRCPHTSHRAPQSLRRNWSDAHTQLAEVGVRRQLLIAIANS